MHFTCNVVVFLLVIPIKGTLLENSSPVICQHFSRKFHSHHRSRKASQLPSCQPKIPNVIWYESYTYVQNLTNKTPWEMLFPVTVECGQLNLVQKTVFLRIHGKQASKDKWSQNGTLSLHLLDVELVIWKRRECDSEALGYMATRSSDWQWQWNASFSRALTLVFKVNSFRWYQFPPEPVKRIPFRWEMARWFFKISAVSKVSFTQWSQYTG